jgi:hypothetical protein
LPHANARLNAYGRNLAMQRFLAVPLGPRCRRAARGLQVARPFPRGRSRRASRRIVAATYQPTPHCAGGRAERDARAFWSARRDLVDPLDESRSARPEGSAGQLIYYDDLQACNFRPTPPRPYAQRCATWVPMPAPVARLRGTGFKIVDHASDDLRKQWAVWDSNPQPAD